MFRLDLLKERPSWFERLTPKTVQIVWAGLVISNWRRSFIVIAWKGPSIPHGSLQHTFCSVRPFPKKLRRWLNTCAYEYPCICYK